jgi:translation initiation factor 1
MKEKKRIPTDGQQNAWTSPFAVLKDLNMSTASSQLPAAVQNVKQPATVQNRGRVDILRQTAHRGGKTVTVVKNFSGIEESEKEQLARQLQKACGAGGTVKNGQIEIQGDHREAVAQILSKAGFRPVLAGG